MCERGLPAVRQLHIIGTPIASRRTSSVGLSPTPPARYCVRSPEILMLYTLRIVAAFSVAAISLPARAQDPAQQGVAVKAPVAERQAHETHIHSYTLTDNYFWLRQKSNPAVRMYLEAENTYTAAVMKPTAMLQQSLY